MRNASPRSSPASDAASGPRNETEYLAVQSRLARASIARTLGGAGSALNRAKPVQWARRHPYLAAGAALAAGFVLVRVVRRAAQNGKRADPAPQPVTPARSFLQTVTVLLWSRIAVSVQEKIHKYMTTATTTAPRPVAPKRSEGGSHEGHEERQKNFR